MQCLSVIKPCQLRPVSVHASLFSMETLRLLTTTFRQKCLFSNVKRLLGFAALDDCMINLKQLIHEEGTYIVI